MIRHVLRKDWTLWWPLVALLTAIQVGFEWASYRAGLFGESHAAVELVRLLSIAWMVGVPALAVVVVQEDPLAGVEQDWLIRPLARTDLLVAKLVFVLLAVCLPMWVLNAAHELALGFAVLPALGFAAYKALFVFLTLLVPAMALASVARNLTELVVLAAALVVLFSASLALDAIVAGPDRCPTCDTPIAWLQHLLQHVGVLVGSAVILALQYYGRRTDLSRWVAAAGVVLLVLLQLPWVWAFAMQSRLGAPPQAAAAVTIALEPQDVSAGDSGSDGGRADAARRSAGQLIHGRIDAAAESLARVRRSDDARSVIELPLHLSGLSRDQFVLADHAEFSLIAPSGRVLYRGTNAARGSIALVDPGGRPDAGEPSGTVAAAEAIAGLRQAVELPGRIYRQVRTLPAHLSVAYSLTLMDLAAEYRMRALDGEVRAPETGLCRSRQEANDLLVVCEQIGQPAVCYAATLHGPDGQHNPQVLECSNDYRPYIPAPINILALSELELPTRDPTGLAHYPVSVSDLSRSYILLRVYAARTHFTRELTGVPFPGVTPTP